MHLIVGLGNPGAQYSATRHNVGQWVIRQASKDWAIPLVPHRVGEMGIRRNGPHPVALIVPVTWMNLTGEVVQSLLHSFDHDASNLIVVHDDLDLPVGYLRIKFGGGSGGHNGLRSIDDCLGTNAYARVKIGIGRPESTQDTADFVLSPFLPEDKAFIEEMVRTAVKALNCMVSEGIVVAMNLFNRRIEADSN